MQNVNSLKSLFLKENCKLTVSTQETILRMDYKFYFEFWYFTETEICKAIGVFSLGERNMASSFKVFPMSYHNTAQTFLL